MPGRVEKPAGMLYSIGICPLWAGPWAPVPVEAILPRFSGKCLWETDGLLHDFDFLLGKAGACVVDKRLKEARQHGAMGLPVGCYRIRPPYPAHCEELECHWHDEMELFKV